MTKISPDMISSLFRKNLTIKLLSLALAISVWGFTFVSREGMHELLLTVDLQNTPSGYSSRNIGQNEVRFTLVGPAALVRSAQKQNSSLLLDLKNTSAGKTQFSNLEKYLNLHPSIRVTRISPAVIEIELFGTQTNSTQGERHK